MWLRRSTAERLAACMKNDGGHFGKGLVMSLKLQWCSRLEKITKTRSKKIIKCYSKSEHNLITVPKLTLVYLTFFDPNDL